MDDVSWNLMPHLKNCVTAFEKIRILVAKEDVKNVWIKCVKSTTESSQNFHSAVTYNDLQFDNLFLESG